MELYIHIPFCVRKCRYCDFLSFPVGDVWECTAGADKSCGSSQFCPAGQVDSYLYQLTAEMEQMAARPEIRGEMVSSVFIGGGTPSLLHPDQFLRLAEAVRKHFPLEDGFEWTIEANPGTITKEKLSAWKEGGINRLSIGLQSASDEELKLLGRIHTFGEFQENYGLARSMGFDNINIDLMSALPGQSVTTWEHTLRTVLALKPEHISAYSLIVEPETPFYEEYGAMAEAVAEYGEYEAMPEELLKQFPEEKRIPGERADREMYHLTKTMLQEAGFHRYEISNYALPGYECRHNRGYWDGTRYLGLGLGAASLIGQKRFSVIRDKDRYMAYSAADFAAGMHLEDVQDLTLREQMEEFMFLGLRLTEGVSESRFRERFGKALPEVYGPVLQKMASEGLMEKTYVCIRQGTGKNGADTRWRLTEQGLDVSNTVLAEFLLDDGNRED